MIVWELQLILSLWFCYNGAFYRQLMNSSLTLFNQRYNINLISEFKKQMNYLGYYASLSASSGEGKQEHSTPSENHYFIDNTQKYQLWRRIQYLQQKCQYLTMENQVLKYGQKDENKIHIKIEVIEKKQTQQQQNNSQKVTKSCKIAKKRRTEKELTKNFNCPYFGCQRDYASALALNLHIRVKHGGGTKKERKQLLKNIIDAQLNGDQLPQININLPPNYLEQKKKLILFCDQFHKPQMHKTQG